MGVSANISTTRSARGLELLGFSDHSPYIFSGDYDSNYRMHPDETAGYFDTLRKLKLEYADKIDLKIGFEAEYYPAHFNDTIDSCAASSLTT